MTTSRPGVSFGAGIRWIQGESVVVVGLTHRVLLFVAGLLMLVSQAIAEDWPQWAGPRGNGTWNGPKLSETWPSTPLPQVWKQEIGGGFGGVAVSDGRTYVMDRVLQPTEQERVLCFDAHTGKQIWTHAWPVAYGKLDYGNGPRATPTITDGRVYTLGALGDFRCLDAATGSVHWSKDFVRDYAATIPMWGLAASPVIWQEMVIVHPGAKQGCVMAFDRVSGKELWRASDDPAGYSTPIVIQAPSGPQVVCWTPEHVLGIAARGGQVVWTIPYKVTYGVSIASPVYAEGLVFVTGYWEGSKAIRLGKSAGDASLAWEDTRHLRGLMEPPLYRDGLVYSIDKHFGLTCFELATGKKLWDDREHRITARGNNPHAAIVWLNDGDRALVLSESGQLLLIRLNAQGVQVDPGPTIINREDGKPIWAHPAFAGSCVYARNDKLLVCVRLPAK